MSVLETMSIEIRPESSVYATYGRLDYKAWYAIGEFVDNATQNFFSHKEEIAAADGSPAQLTIDITYEPHAGTLSVADNANGMDAEELARAVRLNKPPKDRSGRSEFGMGLKMAACWFGTKWTIVTKRLNSDVEYEAAVDLKTLEEENPEHIEVLKRTGISHSLHYSRVEIEGLRKKFQGQTRNKIIEHLSSIYRRDIESGEVVINWNGEPLSWTPDPVFEEAVNGERVVWKKPVDFVVEGLRVTGYVWIRMPGAARRAGMHLFRRGRLVVGGPGEGYKPEEIYEAPNSFQSQRLIGELDLDNWPVTQTKNAFDWEGDLEHAFIMKLKEQVADYVASAKEIRSTESQRPTRADAQLAGDATKNSLSGSSVETAMVIIEQGPPPEPPSAPEELEQVTAASKDAGEPTYISVGISGMPKLKVWWSEDMAPSDVYVKFACPSDDELLLTVNLNHPFVVDVVGRDPARLRLWDLLLYVDALVERGARKRGETVPPSTFRAFKDQFLRTVKAE